MTSDTGRPYPPDVHSRRNLTLFMGALLFASTVFYLLWQIHLVEDERKALVLEQFRSDSDALAQNLHLFLQERHGDLETISESRPVEVYFENVDLGMSPRYGLLASSQEIETLFSKYLSVSRMDQNQLFETFILLDASGVMVAAKSKAEETDNHREYIPDPAQWSDNGEAHEDGFRWSVLGPDGISPASLVMAHPVLHRGELVGQLLVRMALPIVLGELFRFEKNDNQRTRLLACDGKMFFDRSGVVLDLPTEFLGLGREIARVAAPDLPGIFQDTGRPLLAVASPVAGSRLKVLTFAPESIVLGSPTWPLSMLVVLLSALLLSVFVFLIRSHTQKLLIAARFEEQERSGVHLRQRMDEFNTLFDALPGYAWYKNGAGVIVAANAATCAFVGLPVEVVVGKTVHDIFPQDVADGMAELDAQLLRGKRRSLDVEQTFERDGRLMTIANRMVAIVHEDGRIGGIIGLGLDITEKKRVEAELARRASLQAVIMDLAIGFVNTPLQELDQAILRALALIGDFARVDRAYLFAYDFGAGTMSNTHEWCAAGITPVRDNLQGVPNELFPDWIDAHLRKELVHIPDVMALPPEGHLRATLEPQGVRTLIALPLVHGSRCFGFVGFDAVSEQKQWTDAEINLLKVMAELLTNAELRRLHEGHLLEAKAAAEAAYFEVEERVRERTRQLAETNDQLQGEIFERQQAIRNLNLVLSSISAVLIVVDGQGRVFLWNLVAEMAFGLKAPEVEGRDFGGLPIPWDWQSVTENIERCRQSGELSTAAMVRFDRPGEGEAFLMLTVSPVFDEAQNRAGFLLLGEDVTEVRMLEARLAQAAKMEAIGQLAAGIAHEINTPAQYVGDSATFLQDVFAELEPALAGFESFCRSGAPEADVVLREACSALDRIDLGFVGPEIPRTFDRIFDGMKRISSIVQAMNRFSHSHGSEKKLIDLNDIIENTLTISRNEWKYVADIETDLDPGLDPVLGLGDEMGQVFLNIIINAAHAIEDKVRGTRGKGVIAVASRRDVGCAEVSIRDTGAGIPPELGDKVFNLFFTTKDLGKGTGQGLAIAHDIVVNKHGGRISYVSEQGMGTTFIIQIPFGGEDSGRLAQEKTR